MRLYLCHRLSKFNIDIRFSMIPRQITLLDIAVLSTILRSTRRQEDSITSVPHKPHVCLCPCQASKYAIQGSLGLIFERRLPISGDIEIERIMQKRRHRGVSPLRYETYNYTGTQYQPRMPGNIVGISKSFSNNIVILHGNKKLQNTQSPRCRVLEAGWITKTMNVGIAYDNKWLLHSVRRYF